MSLRMFLLLLFIPLSLFSIDFSQLTEKSVQNMNKEENQKFLKDEYEKSKERAIDSLKQTLKFVNADTDENLALLEKAKNKFNQVKKTYILYLTSKSVPKSSVHNFTHGIEVLNKMGEDISGRIIYIGFKRNQPAKEFMDDLNITNAPNSVVNINSMVFYDLDVKKVPAYVIAECPEHFKSLDCDYKYMVKGDIPFEKFLDILNQKNTEYKDLYFKFISPK